MHAGLRCTKAADPFFNKVGQMESNFDPVFKRFLAFVNLKHNKDDLHPAVPSSAQSKQPLSLSTLGNRTLVGTPLGRRRARSPARCPAHEHRRPCPAQGRWRPRPANQVHPGQHAERERESQRGPDQHSAQHEGPLNAGQLRALGTLWGLV